MCNRAELQHILLDTHEGLRNIFGSKLENVLLYGSYARGDQTSESDIDVMALVDLSKSQLAEYRRSISDFSSTIDLQYGVLLSIKLQDSESFRRFGQTLPFFQNVIKEGISIV